MTSMLENKPGTRCRGGLRRLRILKAGIDFVKNLIVCDFLLICIGFEGFEGLGVRRPGATWGDETPPPYTKSLGT